MTYLLKWLLLLFCYSQSGKVSADDEPRCLKYLSEVHPKKYFHFNGTSLNINLETSDRLTHQLSTWVFYYYIKEVVGYTKLQVIHETDNFDIEDVISRLVDTKVFVPNSTINLEVWIPPDYDTYVTDFVKECGSASPPGRFGWFIPQGMTAMIEDYYNPENKTDVKSIHWRFLRNRQFVKYFDIDLNELSEIHTSGYTKLPNSSYVCPTLKCEHSMFVPEQCQKGACATLLTSHYDAMKFVINHVNESKLYVKVLFLGENLRNAVDRLTKSYQDNNRQKSLLILSWTASDVVLYETNFVSVSFESSERLNFTHNDTIGYKYEMHRLVKVAWNKVESNAKPLYDSIRRFKFEIEDYKNLLKLYEENRNESFKDIACMWLNQNPESWYKWKKAQSNIIYIGGIFPMSGSSYNGRGIAKGAGLAIEAINRNTTILRDYNLSVIITDGKCQSDNVMRNFIDFIVNQDYYKNLVGVLGPACSDTVEPLAGVSRHYRIMVISYSAEGASFSNREKYPYFFRTIGENKHYKHVYQELFKRFNWKRVAALTEDGQKYTEYISLMQDDLEKNGISFIANKKFPRERETEPMTRYLEDLKNKRARIIIADVVDEIARQVMCEAYKLQMTAMEGYVWFLPMWLNRTWYDTDFFNIDRNETVNCTTMEMLIAIKGYFSMTHAYFAQDNQIMQENKTIGEWLNNYNAKVKDQKLKSDYAGFAYDAVWVYALALDKLSITDPEALTDIHSENTTNKLVTLIEQTDFYGLSGRIKFRGGPSRFSNINVLQWYDNQTHKVAEFHPNLTDDKPEILGGDLVLNLEMIKWFTHDKKVPGDGTLPPPVCAIGGIATAFNVDCQTALIILNVILAMFLGVTVMGVCLYLKYKYDRRVKKQKAYMQKLGLRYERKITLDLEDFEMQREHIELTRKLGEGAFGTVYGGEVTAPNVNGWLPVAVKTLKLGYTTEDKIDFLAEADNMKYFDHRNVVKLIGVITRATPLATMMEYCLYGDLKNFLLSRRHLAGCSVKGAEEVTSRRLTNMALDIARGISYLASMKYVHRDLASRNCLVNAQRIVKIGDFGMARPMNDYESYHFTRKGMLPVRWMAPESLDGGVFSFASDVWSLGVVMYEICTFGCVPWNGLNNSDVVEKVTKEKLCIEPPVGIKPQFEGLMKSCWARDPKDRPTASSIVEFIANMPKLITPITDLPAQSIKLDEVGLEPGREDYHRNNAVDSPSQFVPINGIYLWTEIVPEEDHTVAMIDDADEIPENTSSDVSIPLESYESYCARHPLLPPPQNILSKSLTNLINFGKFHMQNGRRDSGLQNGEDDRFLVLNGPYRNGIVNNSNHV